MSCRGVWNMNRSNSARPTLDGWTHARSNAQEVARIFQIPPDLLGIAIQGGTGSITYKNLAEVGADFVQFCLSPYITILESAWVRLAGQPGITFDTTPLYKESLKPGLGPFNSSSIRELIPRLRPKSVVSTSRLQPL